MFDQRKASYVESQMRKYFLFKKANTVSLFTLPGLHPDERPHERRFSCAAARRECHQLDRNGDEGDCQAELAVSVIGDCQRQIPILINVKTGGQKRQNVWEEITYTIFRKHPGFGIMNMCLYPPNSLSRR